MWLENTLDHRKGGFPMVFNQTCMNNNLQPKYTLYILEYVYTLVCECVSISA